MVTLHFKIVLNSSLPPFGKLINYLSGISHGDTLALEIFGNSDTSEFEARVLFLAR